MEIKLKDNFILESDSNNFMLKRIVIPEDNSKKAYKDTLGYYISLEQTLKAFVNKALLQSKASTVDELLAELKELKKYIHDILEGY